MLQLRKVWAKGGADCDLAIHTVTHFTPVSEGIYSSHKLCLCCFGEQCSDKIPFATSANCFKRKKANIPLIALTFLSSNELL